MAIKVKVPYLTSYSCPNVCVMCGNAPGPGMNWSINKSIATGSKGTTMLLFSFPLCQECDTAIEVKMSTEFLKILFRFLAIAVLFLGAILDKKYFGELGMIFYISIALSILCLILGNVLPNEINQKGFTSEQRERRKRVKQSAEISSIKTPNFLNKNGSIIFIFENQNFATGFSLMNSGEILS
ncbi:MAG: hypothetical protein CVU39_09145 [Chloroflexi bacterium HGW-Chloroflexi-10]|nr:MAG: hypothetical protein CVU39_09145 [Chloroflexi bacterium HGW-Chloroflexi-10]